MMGSDHVQMVPRETPSPLLGGPPSRLWYLATPYSRYEAGLDAAFTDAARQAALLIRAGVAVFSPITHSHPIALYGGLDPLDHSLWLPMDEPLMDAAFGLIVCKLPGWEESIGIAHEVERFREAGKPVVCMKPWVVPVGRIRKAEGG